MVRLCRLSPHHGCLKKLRMGSTSQQVVIIMALAPQIHIFIAHKAPWHVITGELIQHDEYPPPNNFGTVPDPQLSPAQHGGVRGSCLCGAIQFEVVEPFKTVHQCHCGRCRRARAAAHATNGFTSIGGVQFSRKVRPR